MMGDSDVDGPADRGRLTTERRSDASAAFDTLSVEEALRLINREDATVAAAVQRAVPALVPVVEAVVAALRRGGRLIYIGAGTSGRLGVLDSSECPPTFHCDPEQVVGVIAGGDRALRHSVEGAEDDDAAGRRRIDELEIGADEVVVGIAAGGTTPYVHGALAAARARGAVAALLCCVPAEQIAPDDATRDLADHVIAMPVGPEILTGSTRMKSATATKMALNMITTTAMARLGKIWGNLMVDLRATNDKLLDRAARIVSEQGPVSRSEALDLLRAASGRVKVALVMARRGVDAAAAEALLAEHDQNLRAVIGAPRGGKH